MSRIHPDLNRFQDLSEKVKDNDNQFQNQYRIDNSNSGSDDQVLTVWKRSSMSFQGTDGFTVFDSSSGRLVFRVDNYSRKDRFGCRRRTRACPHGWIWKSFAYLETPGN
ncbi:hypothetical protein HYC85_022247 [Camellia sinensis]|uniref:Uncharacterized protein n=1 Tax=Camellia sinensis TaxID=4442 RepID=A0A7J7GK80_CAMSI|nr:hypothetical protein HYC85_022247 [Camellia sinensis]